jgi:outer membrane protein
LPSKINNRLQIDESFTPNERAIAPPKTLREEIDEAKKSSKDRKVMPLVIDVKKAIAPYDEPDAEAGVMPNLLKETGLQLSIAEVRSRALKNNLSLKVFQYDPVIAQTIVREEEAKFDKIIFAYAKYGDRDLPGSSGDNVQFKSDNPALDAQQLKIDIA